MDFSATILAMTGAIAFRLLILGSLAAPFCLAAQQASTPTRPAYDGSDSLFAPMEIHVLGDCRIVPAPDPFASRKKQRPFRDDTICHLESIASSEHTEEAIVGNQLERSNINISEHEFVLQNIAPRPVIFYVEQQVPKDWSVDSDPQPTKMVGSTAIFPVHVAPGQIVRLHVGIRHTTPLKPRVIDAKSPYPAGTAGN
jgi:hypothetical protein